MVCFFFKQKTAYEMRISDWSSDVCSSDLLARIDDGLQQGARKLPSGDGLGQRLHDLVLARGAVIDPVQALAPPLQADAADHRLAHHLRRLGHLMVEEIGRASCRERVCQYG